MLKSESKETGNPLSVIPKYTVNTMLDWQVNDAPVCECELDALWPSEAASVYEEIRNETGTLATTEVGTYSIVGNGTLSIQLNQDIHLKCRNK
ncbi:hypothetical protein MJ588_12005 [Klebsiella pneumoniae]|nr:hypothetical protein MJ588_12005 [Klebsiella pneumoniae]